MKMVSELPPKPKAKKEATPETFMWTDIYQPTGVGDLVGNSGSIDQLFIWLRDWDDVIINGKKKEVHFRGGNWADAPKPNARACLLSGPPGIGKSSSARIVCQQLGYEVIEQNASDVRSKAAIEDNIRTLSSNTNLDYFYKANKLN